MDSVADNGSSFRPSTDHFSGNSAPHVHDRAFSDVQKEILVSAAQPLFPGDGKSVSSLNTDDVGALLSDHLLMDSPSKRETVIFQEPLPAASDLPSISGLVWRDSLEEGDGDSDLKIQIQSTCSIDRNVFEQMSSLSDKQTLTGFTNSSEFICKATTGGKQAVTGCDESVCEAITEGSKAVDCISRADREKKVQEFTCVPGSISTSKTVDLVGSNRDCHLTGDMFPECDSTEHLASLTCQPLSGEPDDMRGTREKSDRVSDLNDQLDVTDMPPPSKKVNISEYSETETRIAEIPEMQTLVRRVAEGSHCCSSEVRPLASEKECDVADTTSGDDKVQKFTRTDIENASEKAGAETSDENKDLLFPPNCTARSYKMSNADSVYGKTEPKQISSEEELNSESKEPSSALGENSKTEVNNQEISQDQENYLDVESKMDLDEGTAELGINVDVGKNESESSTKEEVSDWSPSSIPTLGRRGNNQLHCQKQKPLISSKFQPAQTPGLTDRQMSEGQLQRPKQGTVRKRPLLADPVPVAESWTNRIPSLMDADAGVSGFCGPQKFNTGDQQRQWNDGSKHDQPFNDPFWSNAPLPGYMGPFHNGMSFPPLGPGISLPPPGMPLPPPGMPVPNSSGGIPGLPPMGGMLVPPPPVTGLDPPGSMLWGASMPLPPNSMPQPFSLPPPSFMPPPGMAPPGSVAPPYGMLPAGVLPPPYDLSQGPPAYFGQYPCVHPNIPVQPDQSYQEWYAWWQSYSQWMQQCNSKTTIQTWPTEVALATTQPVASSTSQSQPSSSWKQDSLPQKDKAKPSSAKTVTARKEENRRLEKESVSSISLPAAKPKLTFKTEAKPRKPSSLNRLPNLTSLAASFHSDSTSRSRISPTKEAEQRDRGSSENMLWIGNLPPETRALDLRSVVSEYGKVSNCKVGALKSQKDAGLFALVTMETADDADFCIRRLNNSIYNGQSIIVKKFQKD